MQPTIRHRSLRRLLAPAGVAALLLTVPASGAAKDRAQVGIPTIPFVPDPVALPATSAVPASIPSAAPRPLPPGGAVTPTPAPDATA